MFSLEESALTNNEQINFKLSQTNFSRVNNEMHAWIQI